MYVYVNVYMYPCINYIYTYTYIYSESISTSSCSLSATVMTLPKVGNLCLRMQGYLWCMRSENLNLYFEKNRVYLYILGGSLPEGEGIGNYRNATVPVSVPRILLGNYGNAHP